MTNPIHISAVQPLRLPGIGNEALKRVGPLVQACERDLQTIAHRAISRWAGSRNATSGFTARELGRLVATLATSTAAAELLGRSQIAIAADHAAQFPRVADSRIFERFASPVPALTPQQALQYFLQLVPRLGIDPERFGQRVERHAFTLAAAVEQTLVNRVQKALAEEIDAQRTEDSASRGSQPLSGAERVQQLLDAAGVSPRNPQYAEMVFRTNVLDSYHAGVDRELAKPQMQDAFPVWQYLGLRDGRQGKDHEIKFGLYFPSSASFSEVRGNRVYNCRCSKKPITHGAWKRLQEQGATVTTTW